MRKRRERERREERESDMRERNNRTLRHVAIPNYDVLKNKNWKISMIITRRRKMINYYFDFIFLN